MMRSGSHVAVAAAACLAVAGGPSAFAQEDAETVAALSARLAALEAREEIRTLLYEYGRRLDAGDYAGYAALFAEDGEWIGGFGRFQGPAAIQAMLEDAMPRSDEPGQPSSFHIMSSPQIEVDGDHATAWSRWSFVSPDEDGAPRILFGGHYDDALVREDGVWKFQRRVAYGDIPFDDPLAEE